jgi:hypothetical protein
VPADARGQRLPTAGEVADALVAHERAFRRDILQGALGLRAAAIPPLHIGEFGMGSDGLRHPNLWAGLGTAAEEAALAEQITRGHEGLVRYLSRADGRGARSAVLWVTGPHYELLGWGNPAWAIPGARAAIEAGLRSYVAPAP